MRSVDTKDFEISPPSAVEKEVRFPRVHSTCQLRLGVYPKSEQKNNEKKRRKVKGNDCGMLFV